MTKQLMLFWKLKLAYLYPSTDLDDSIMTLELTWQDVARLVGRLQGTANYRKLELIRAYPALLAVIMLGTSEN